MSLHHFLTENRQELIKRTRAKVAARSTPQPNETELEHGVPILLTQLATALGHVDKPSSDHATGDIKKSATMHGQDLRKWGFTIEQVVHDYGDVCQAVTELAVEKDALVTTAEFRTLNRCLDDAIAGAVSSWSKEEGKAIKERSGDENMLLLSLSNLVGTAIVSFGALQGGTVGIGGATGTLHRKCLTEMRDLVDKAMKTSR
jgi:hypothetical protein